MKLMEQIRQPLDAVMKIFSSGEEKPINIPEEQNIFGFYSPTGGTGVTTLVANLATILAQHKTVAVLDLDIAHPSLHRFFLAGDTEENSLRFDIIDKFIATGKDLVELGHTTKVENVTLFSSLLDTDIIRYCELDEHNICLCIKELSKLYDYVLVDINGGLTQESVWAGITSCTKVYTLIRPCISDLERVYKDTLILSNYSAGAKTKNIIQSPVGDSYLSNDIVEEYQLNNVMAIPYTKKVESIGYNYDIFVSVDGGSGKAEKKYIQCCIWLAERLANYGLEEEVT